MKPYIVRSAVLAFTVLLSACLESKEVGTDLLSDVDEGMPKESLYAIIKNGPLTAQYADTLRVERGFRRSSYFVNGKTYEVVYYREQPGNVAEPVDQYKETPIVLADGKVLGWGWAFYLEAMDKYNLPSPIEAKPEPTPPAAPPQPPAAPDSTPKA